MIVRIVKVRLKIMLISRAIRLLLRTAVERCFSHVIASIKMRDGRIYYSKCYLIKDLAQKAIKAMLERADIKVIKARRARRATGVTPDRLAFPE